MTYLLACCYCHRAYLHTTCILTQKFHISHLISCSCCCKTGPLLPTGLLQVAYCIISMLQSILACAVLATLHNFTQSWNYPKYRRWRRWCATGMCCIRQSHSTLCNSCGYDLISLAAALQPWDVARRLRDVTQQLGDVVEALRLSHCGHCLVARAVGLLHSCASDWEL